jgi:hypothetical protein
MEEAVMRKVVFGQRVIAAAGCQLMEMRRTNKDGRRGASM